MIGHSASVRRCRLPGLHSRARKFDGIYLGQQKDNHLVCAGKVDHGFRYDGKDLQLAPNPLVRKTQPYGKKDRASRHLGSAVIAG
jgi:hypothetical protein